MMLSKMFALSLAFASVALLGGCGGSDPDPGKLGFSSMEEMQEIQAQGWRTKQRYEQDQRDASLERMLVVCYGPYQHAANVAQGKDDPRTMVNVRFATEMRQDLVRIWARKGFSERDADGRAHAIYSQYPPSRAEYFLHPETSQMAYETERAVIKQCKAYAEQDPAYFKDLAARVAKAGQ